MSRPRDVIIVGAGPAGLTAGYLLTKAGQSVTILERDPDYVGGISRTVDYKGFLFDIGGHRFFSKSREVVELWHELLPDDFVARPRLSRIYYNGKFFAYPLQAFEALTKLGSAIAKSQVRLPNGPLKTVGEFPVSVAAHTDVVVEISVQVVAEVE